MLSLKQLESLALFKGGTIDSIVPLEGGLSHQLTAVYFTHCSREKRCIVLRYLTNLSGAQNEYKIMQHAYQLNIGPAVDSLIDVSELVGRAAYIIAMAYVEGELATNNRWTDGFIDRLARHLNRLHHQPLPNFTLPNSVNKLSLLDEYWLQVNNPCLTDKHRFDTLKTLTQPLKFNDNFVIHGDLNFNNILLNNDEMVWLDWEYSSIGDCYFDYATILMESPQDIQSDFINGLERILPSCVIDTKRLNLFNLYYCGTSWLWSLMRNADKETIRYQQKVDQMIARIGDAQISL